MTEKKFLEELADVLGVTEDKIAKQMELESFEQWDSLSMLTMLDLYDEMQLDVEVDDVESCKTIADLTALASFR
jgi:acyl carrier protein